MRGVLEELGMLKEKANKLLESLIQYKYWKEFLKGAFTSALMVGLSLLFQEVIKYFFGMEALMKVAEFSVYFTLGFFFCLYFVLYIDKKQRKERLIRAELKAREEALR
jgi:hypothetical protein